jgi:5'-3' exonuclease
VGPADQKPQPKSLEQAVAAAVASKTTSTVADDERTPFQFLQIHVLREYLHKEFSGGDYSVEPRGFDLERAIDDFIFLCETSH